MTSRYVTIGVETLALLVTLQKFMKRLGIARTSHSKSRQTISKKSVRCFAYGRDDIIFNFDVIEDKLQCISVELGTGSVVTVLSKTAWQKVGAPQLEQKYSILRCYNGEIIVFIEAGNVQVQYRQERKALQMLVLEEAGKLLGREWIGPLGLSILSF